jgi:hypothetical protein
MIDQILLHCRAVRKLAGVDGLLTGFRNLPMKIETAALVLRQDRD